MCNVVSTFQGFGAMDCIELSSFCRNFGCFRGKLNGRQASPGCCASTRDESKNITRSNAAMRDKLIDIHDAGIRAKALGSSLRSSSTARICDQKYFRSNL